MKLFVILTTLFFTTSTLRGDEQFEHLKTAVFDRLQNTWCSQEKANLIMDLIVTTRPQVCVEIGAFTGSSFLPIAATLQYLGHGHAYAIDAWSNAEAVKHLTSNDVNTQWWSAVNMDEAQARFANMIDNWRLSSCCTVIHAPSDQAVCHIGSINFLHLDGNCSEAGALRDAQLYVPKVKSGGYILLSNHLVYIDGEWPKMKSLWDLLDTCDVVQEVDNSNTVLFVKK